MSYRDERDAARSRAEALQQDVDCCFGGCEYDSRPHEHLTPPAQLDKADIVAGMRQISRRVAACFTAFEVPGMASVSVTIGNDGSVPSASVGGAFSGTPTGICVENVVKTARFVRFTGRPQTITYPFVLR